MKVAVIGYGNVGMAVYSTFINMPEVHELALVGRNVKRVRGEVSDYRDAQVLNHGFKKRLIGGGYEYTRDADILIYTAGSPVKNASQSRSEILQENLEVARDISDELNKYNRDAFIIVISNPVDIITEALIKYTGRSRNKVIGTGTLLDTARLCRFTAEILGIQSQNVETCVLGEHGSSSCIIWSWSRIMGFPLDEFFNAELPEPIEMGRDKLLEINRRAGYKIYEQKGSTAYGVAAAAARIADAFIYDTNEIIPVSVYTSGEYGINDVALSLPCLISRNGAMIFEDAKISDDEHKALLRSAQIIKDAKGNLL